MVRKNLNKLLCNAKKFGLFLGFSLVILASFAGCGTVNETSWYTTIFQEEGNQIVVEYLDLADNTVKYFNLMPGDQLKLQNLHPEYQQGMVNNCFYMLNSEGENKTLYVYPGLDPQAMTPTVLTYPGWLRFAAESKSSYALRLFKLDGGYDSAWIPYGRVRGILITGIQGFKFDSSDRALTGEQFFNAIQRESGEDRTICFRYPHFISVTVKELSQDLVFFEEVPSIPDDPNRIAIIDKIQEDFAQEKPDGAQQTLSGDQAPSAPAQGASGCSLHKI